MHTIANFDVKIYHLATLIRKPGPVLSFQNALMYYLHKKLLILLLDDYFRWSSRYLRLIGLLLNLVIVTKSNFPNHE
jgi:hypothetical protein